MRKKKKVLVFLLFIVLVALMLSIGCGSKQQAPTAPSTGEKEQEAPKQPEKTWNLQFCTFWPATDFQVVEGHMAWAKEIEERTNGRVTFTFHPGNALLGATEIYTGVADGAADLGTTCPAYTPGMFPVTEVFELPMFNNENALVASMTMWEAFKTMDELQKEYKDVKVLMFWATGPGDFMTKSPVHKMEDLKGMQIRSVGGTFPSVEALGATPVSMPMSDAYLALDSGLLQGILAPNDVLEGFKLAEVVNYVTKTPFIYNIVFMKVMNWDTWNSFDPEIQKIFDEVSEAYVEKYGKLRTDYTAAGLQYGIKKHGIEVIELSPEEYQRWVNQVSPVIEKWIEKTDKLGLPGKDLVERAKKIEAKMSQKYGAYGR